MGLYDEQSKHLEDGDSAYFEGLELDILQRATSNDGSSLLTVAALKGQVNCCRVICERCPQLLYQTNRSGRTAMHVAASHGKEEVIKFLQVVEQERVDAKSIVEEEIDYKLSMMQDHLGNTALHLAAQGGHYPSANLLLDADPSGKLLGMVNNDGETELHVAVKYVRFEIVKLLVQADPDFEYYADKSGHIPIFIAFNMALSGDEEKVKIRNLLIRRQRGQCMHKNEIGRTLLHHATYKNNIPTVMEILDSWKECSEMVDDKDGNFLHLAVWLEHKELIELILDSKKVSDKVINGKNDNGETPLHIAILTENRHLILTLLYNERVKKTIPNKQGNNVLNSIPFGYDKRRAGLYGWEELKDHRDFKGQSQNTYDEQFKRVRDGHIVYFMRVDLDILKNAKSNDGSSLLSYAAREGDLICCQVIYIRCPQLLYQTNSSRSTALHAAVMSFTPESIAIVKFLLAVDQEEKLPMMQDMHGHTFFHLAAEKFYFNKIIENLILIWNHADLVKKLLGVVNYKGETTLHLAVQSNHIFSIELLIKVDPDFEYSADDSGNTPILAAAKMAMSGDEERVKIRRFLIKNQHAQCRLPVGNNKWTLLHHAAHEGDLGTIKDIIDLWPDCCKLLDEEGQNFLHLAVRSGQVEVVKYIFELENIEDNVLNGTDKCGNTPWHFIPPGKIDGIALFIRDNSRVDVMAKNMEGKTILDAMGIGVSGWTLLHHAARNGDMVAIEEIIKSNPDCCNVVNEDNQNFIHLAAMYDKIAVVKFGLELATLSKEVLNAMDIHGNTPLHVARSCGYTHIASTLIQDSRVDTTIENKRKIIAQNMGRSVLFQRASKGDAHFFMEVQEDMLLNSRDEDGESLLSIAARDGHFNCCKVICERCSRLLYQTNKNGVSALHRETSNASGNIIKYLLGVEVKMKQQGLQNHGRVAGEEETNTKILGLIDNNKDTAMHYAVRSHNFMIVQLLLNADPAFKYSDNKSGYTPAFLALQGIHSDHGSIDSFAFSKHDLSTIREIIDLWDQCLELVDKNGENFLHLATRLGYNTIVEYIVGLKDLSKEFFNRKNNNKETPLHIAISSGNQNVALSLLYEHRVNKWILDKHGKNVLKAIRFDYDKRQAEVFGFMDEKELKDQSEFDLLVGALITTVAFTAGITVPGGFIPDGPNRGNAILHRKPTFEVFVVSNTIALALSLFAVFTHFCMKSLDETETVIQLKVAKFCSIGSIYALMVAFVMGSFSVLSISLRLAIIVTGICCCFFGCSFYSLWRMRKNRQKYRRQFN